VYDLSVYDAKFYELVEREGKLMAPWFVPLLKEVFDFHSLVDVGCGTGHYLRWCADNFPDTDLLGVEGSSHAVDHALLPGSLFLHDLRRPLEVHLPSTFNLDEFDLAISVEVAEHLEEEFADNYVRILCDLGKAVLITAAPPGQGGTKHVNCQHLTYWVDKFAAHGKSLDVDLTLAIKRGIAAAIFHGKYVTAWFEPNVAVFV